MEEGYILIWGLFAGAVISALFIWRNSGDNIKLRRKWWIGAVLGVSCWMWGPWIAYGIYALGRWNINQINWIERPPVVEPADQEHIKAKHGVER